MLGLDQRGLVYEGLAVGHGGGDRQVVGEGTQHYQRPEQEAEEETDADQVRPDVHGLVVEHEQRLTDLAFAVEVDAVPRQYVLIVDYVVRRLLHVPDERLQLLFPATAHRLQLVDTFLQDPVSAFLVYYLLFLIRHHIGSIYYFK